MGSMNQYRMWTSFRCKKAEDKYISIIDLMEAVRALDYKEQYMKLSIDA